MRLRPALFARPASFGFFALAALLHAAGDARGDEPSTGPGAALNDARAAERAQTAAARRAHEKGLASREKGDWQAAYSAFLEAWRHKRHWEIAVNLGEAEMKIGDHDGAMDHLLFAMSEPGFLERSPHLVEAERRQIIAWLDEAIMKMPAPAPARRADARAPSAAPAARTWMWIAGAGGGLSVATIVAGSVMTAMAGGKVGEVKASLSELPGEPGDPAAVRCVGFAEVTCRANEERLRTADSLQSAGTALFLTAGAATLASAVVAIFGWRRGVTAPAVMPSGGPSSGGIVIRADW